MWLIFERHGYRVSVSQPCPEEREKQEGKATNEFASQKVGVAHEASSVETEKAT